MKFFLALLLIGVTSSFAEDKSRGCGVGTLIAPKKSLFSTTTAEVTDFASMPTRPFAMTTGTSGCAPHSLITDSIQREHFIAFNRDQLRIETALGAGEHVLALSQSFGCAKSDVFISVLKKNYKQTFVEDLSAKKIEEKLKLLILNSPELAECLI